jgi:hypothetical protein
MKTKLKTKLLKFVSVVLILYPAAATIWQTLPEDITTLIPQYTEYIALVTGGSSAVLGAVGLAFTSSINSTQDNSFEIFNGLYQAYTKLKESTESSVETVNTNTATITKLQAQFTTIESYQKDIIELQKANLALKLSNPLVDEETKAIYEKLLGGE